MNHNISYNKLTQIIIRRKKRNSCTLWKHGLFKEGLGWWLILILEYSSPQNRLLGALWSNHGKLPLWQLSLDIRVIIINCLFFYKWGVLFFCFFFFSVPKDAAQGKSSECPFQVSSFPTCERPGGKDVPVTTSVALSLLPLPAQDSRRGDPTLWAGGH